MQASTTGVAGDVSTMPPATWDPGHGITHLSHLGPMDFILEVGILGTNIRLIKMKIMKRLKREAEPETAIEFAQDLQDLQDLQNGTCKPLPLVSERPSLVPPFLPPESKGANNRG